ncbi:hypothetical protein NUM3379_24380 [Kineococcus sp. NUM-3379]
MRLTRTVLTAVPAAAVAAAAATLVAPGWFGLAATRPWLYAAALRVPVLLALVLAAALAALLALVLRRRAAGAAVRAVAAALALAAAASTVVVLGRGAGAGSLPAPQPGDVTVVAANTLVSGVEAQVVADLVLRSGADVVAMPETSRELALAVAGAVRRGGGPVMQVLDRREGRWGTHSTALLVSDRWGQYRQLPPEDLPMRLGAVTALPVSGDGPPLAAVHPLAPPPPETPEEEARDIIATWRAEGRAAVAWCAAHPGALVAGDFNATLDHPSLSRLGGCADVSAATGTGARGTWHARVPALLGAPIDHVLADSARWRPVASEVVDLPGSDHRAVVARVRPV